MANSLFDDDAYQSRMAGPWEGTSDYAPTPGNFGRTPSNLYSPSPAPNCDMDQLQPSHLEFLSLAEWQEGGEYDELPPRYICYTIAWKLTLNRKRDYWGKILQAKVEDMLQAKKKRHQRVRSEGTAVTVKVDERSQKNLENFYNSTDINWTQVEKQLRKWSNLLRIGRKVTIEIAFTYREQDDGHYVLRRVEKRGRVSATSRMLAEREAHIMAGEEVTGQPSTWEHVYDLYVGAVSKTDVERIKNVASTILVDNETLEWDCQDYVLEILDKLEDDYVLEGDDEDYREARSVLKGKRGAIV
ncbi:hypothetical protein PITC_014070 [Penicillium italicum]|uniref:Uncharacterized protein n=1 Tax=Penicillium italicum TaxID=40296 RepID=A0A0A2KNU5_PENIT|nr:hypothetical protein PITC_014070 [Penicillium italicum]